MAMSVFPTPPPTSSKHLADKENINPTSTLPFEPSSSCSSSSKAAHRVIFSQSNLQHPYNFQARDLPASMQQTKPAKSILKKPSVPNFLELVPEPKPRDMTPEPANPLQHSHYLRSPLNTLTASLDTPESAISLHDLTEAYSVLSARLRTHLPAITSSDLPALESMKLNCDRLTRALERDIARALVDPTEAKQTRTPLQTPRRQVLGTPKKVGLTEHQVTFARDLCALSHAALRFASTIFAHDVLRLVFGENNLTTLLTRVLAIPLAPTLPTPNPRKTWALAVWVLQVQRLPSTITAPAADRICYALRRGIEGELGREGKKGAGADSYRAIHQLVVYQPDIFLPAFTPLVPSILNGLLSPTPQLVIQAAFALGGIALALSVNPTSPSRCQISKHTIDYLAEQYHLRKSPSQPSPIFRALSLPFHLANKDNNEVVSKSQWALPVLGALVTLCGPHFFTHPVALKPIMKSLELVLSHPRSIVRTIGAYVWRCLAVEVMHALDVAYAEPEDDGQMEADDRSGGQWQVTEDEAEATFRIVKQLLEGGLGQSLVAALISKQRQSDSGMPKAFFIVRELLEKPTWHKDGLNILHRLLCPPVGNHSKPLEDHRLLYPGLFDGRILTTEWKLLPGVIKAAKPEYCSLQDVRTLDAEEIKEHHETLRQLWVAGLNGATVTDDGELPEALVQTWAVLVQSLPEPPVEELVAFLTRSPATWTSMPSNLSASTDFFQISFIKQLFAAVQVAFAYSHQTQLSSLALSLGNLLLEPEWDLENSKVRAEWISFVATLCLMSEQLLESSFDMEFLDTASVRADLWREIAKQWTKQEVMPWSTVSLVCGAPFGEENRITLSEEDWVSWDAVVSTVGRADEVGPSSLLDSIAAKLDKTNETATLLRAAISLWRSVDLTVDLSIPSTLLELTNSLLVASYRDANEAVIVLVTRGVSLLTEVVQVAPAECVLAFASALDEGVSVWIEDNLRVVSAERYQDIFTPFFEAVLSGLKALPPTVGTIAMIPSLLCAVSRSRTPGHPLTLSPGHMTCLGALLSFWRDCCMQFSPDEIPYPLKPLLMAMNIDCGVETQTWEETHVQAEESQVEQQQEPYKEAEVIFESSQVAEGSIDSIFGMPTRPTSDQEPISFQVKKEIVENALLLVDHVIDLTEAPESQESERSIAFSQIPTQPQSPTSESQEIPGLGGALAMRPCTPPASALRAVISSESMNPGKFPTIPFGLVPQFAASFVSPVRGETRQQVLEVPLGQDPVNLDEEEFVESSLIGTPENAQGAVSTTMRRKRRRDGQYDENALNRRDSQGEESPIQASQQQRSSQQQPSQWSSEGDLFNESENPSNQLSLPRVRTPQRMLRSNSRLQIDTASPTKPTPGSLNQLVADIPNESAVEAPKRFVLDSIILPFRTSLPNWNSPSPAPSPTKPLARFFEDDEPSPSERPAKRPRFGQKKSTNFFGPASRKNGEAYMTISAMDSPAFRRICENIELPASDDSLMSGHHFGSDMSDTASRLGQFSPNVIVSPPLRPFDGDIPSDDSIMADSPSQGLRRRMLQRTKSMPSQSSALSRQPHPLRRAQTDQAASDVMATLEVARGAVVEGVTHMNAEQLIQAHKLLGEINSRLSDEMLRIFADRDRL